MSYEEAVAKLQEALRYLEGTPRNAQQRQHVPFLVRLSREALGNLQGEVHFHRGRATSFLKESRERGERIHAAYQKLHEAQREAKALRRRNLQRAARATRLEGVLAEVLSIHHAGQCNKERCSTLCDRARHALGLP